LYYATSKFQKKVNISCKRFSAWDFVDLYNAMFNYDWSSLYNVAPVNAAVNGLNIAVAQATDLVVPSGHN
jgi:hypothetical protein